MSDEDLVNYKIFLFNSQLLANHLRFQMTVVIFDDLDTGAHTKPYIEAIPRLSFFSLLIRCLQ